MRAFERQPNESEKAYAAFCCYRDLGSGRSLAKAAETYYGSRANLAQVGVWSSKFSWVERARSYDDWTEMVGRAAIEDHLARGAEDRARREARLLEQDLRLRELAQEQAEKMLRWPMTEQRKVEEGEDGDTTYVFSPAGWSKATAIAMRNMALGNARADAPVDEMEFDFSDWSEGDMIEFMRLSEMLTPKRKTNG